MLRKSVALGANFSAVLSLLDLDIFGPITFWLSKGQTSEDRFTLYGTLDAGAVDATNAANLGSFNGTTPREILDGYARQAATWPYLLIKRNAGLTPGLFYCAGDEAAPVTVASNAAPAIGNYTAVFDLTGYSAAGVRIGGSAMMAVDDVFLVYATEDSTVTSSTGCQLVGRITGGGETNQISCIVKGFPYAIVQRVSGTVAGNILACGVAPPIFSPGGSSTVPAIIVGPSDSSSYSTQFFVGDKLSVDWNVAANSINIIADVFPVPDAPANYWTFEVGCVNAAGVQTILATGTTQTGQPNSLGPLNLGATVTFTHPAALIPAQSTLYLIPSLTAPDTAFIAGFGVYVPGSPA